jgi:pimeloyl-[acyl-carrier protein] methyl ester esterase
VKPTSALWLGGWSVADSVFDRLRLRLPDYRHQSVDLNGARAGDDLVAAAREAAARCRSDGDRLLFFGWSLGGMLALRIASEGGADGLVLFGSTPRFVRSKGQSNPGWPDAIVQRMAAALGADRSATEQKFREGLLTEQEKTMGHGQWLPEPGSWPDAALAAGLDYLRSEDVRPLLERVTCPALLVHGTEDRICSPEAGTALAEMLPRASLVSVAHAGHAAFLGREAQTADWIRNWWDGTQGQGDGPPVRPQRQRFV